MRRDNLAIIADAPKRFGAIWIMVGLFAAGVTLGSAAALFYGRQDLTLSHYDARAHVMVARRLVDSLTPGWRQIGAVWLPLPHLVNAPLVLPDWSYRTAALPVLFSVTVLAFGLSVLARYLQHRTGSTTAAIAAPLAILVNPNVLYLQSTPMTEPLLIGLSFVALAAVDAWVERPDDRRRRRAGLTIALLALTRYEGWCIAGALAGVGAFARRGDRWRALGLFPYLVASVCGFLWLGWATTGRWFVASGFFVPENPSLHRPWAAFEQVATATEQLAGSVLLATGAAGAVFCLLRVRRSPAHLLPFAMASASALPWLAFVQGHPYRVRYMVPLVAAAATFAGWAIAAVPVKARIVTVLALAGAIVYQRPPLDQQAPMVVEAQWETPFRHERRAVTAYLARHYDGTPILASMGSLGHYMQETSGIGLPLAAFLHEGNGDLWTAAVAHPARLAGWVLIEERAEGGDDLARLAARNADRLNGFTRVADGGGVALYRRDQPLPP